MATFEVLVSDALRRIILLLLLAVQVIGQLLIILEHFLRSPVVN